jgi:hypothetical protein
LNNPYLRSLGHKGEKLLRKQEILIIMNKRFCVRFRLGTFGKYNNKLINAFLRSLGQKGQKLLGKQEILIIMKKAYL